MSQLKKHDESCASNTLSSGNNNDREKRLQFLLDKAERYSRLLVNGAIRFQKTPRYMKGELRLHQIQALNWLIFLFENKIGGILADEMGLGKTVQAIAILGYLKYFKNIHGPFLVIGTLSVMSSWMSEFKKFCPDMRVIDTRSVNKDVLRHGFEDHRWDVYLTNYDSIWRDVFFRKHQWNYVVIDESQRLSNENSVFGKLIRKISTEYRLLLTGTPLQNNLHELWAILNYLMPDIFNDSHAFDGHDNESLSCIKTILQPFFLRRTKADVEASLLPKIEMKLFIGMTKLQRETSVKTINESPSNRQIERLHDLQKIADHPYLIPSVDQSSSDNDCGSHLVNTSGKMMVLDKLLKDLKANGSRVLLFCQFTGMLDILEDYLYWRKYRYSRLDSKTAYTQRAIDIDEFNALNSNIFIYIISTRVGALGINLQTADTVIMFDSDWNPQTDLQAIDRAHRIGQKKQVRVYRFITENTVDECIAQRADIKLKLMNIMIERGCMYENFQVTQAMKRKVLEFGIAAIKSSSKDGITEVDMNTLHRYSQQKSAYKAKELEEMDENRLREVELEELLPIDNSHGKGSLYGSSVQQNNRRKSEVSRDIRPLATARRWSDTLNSQTMSIIQPATRAKTVDHHIVSRNADSEKQQSTMPSSSSGKRNADGEVRSQVNEMMSMMNWPTQSLKTENDSDPDVVIVEDDCQEPIVLTDEDNPIREKRNFIHLDVHQFYPTELINMCTTDRNLDMSTDVEKKETLLGHGFQNWTQDDYKTFCDAVMACGRIDLNGVIDLMPSKEIDDVIRYHEVFFRRGPSESEEIRDIVEQIKLEELKHQRCNEAIKWKMLRFGLPEFQTIANRLRSTRFTADHDYYLVCAVVRYGLTFDTIKRIIADIRFHSDFGLFTTFRFGMISDQEIKDRINQLVAFIQKEYSQLFPEYEDTNIKSDSSETPKKRKTN